MLKPFEPCSKCKGKNVDNKGTVLAPDGFIVDCKTYPFPVVKPCECKMKWDRENQIYLKYKSAGFDEKYYDYNPRTYAGTKSLNSFKRIQNYAVQFKENPTVRKLLLYIYGPNGCQKTSVMSFVGKKILEEGFSVKYILMNNLIKMLQESSFKSNVSVDYYLEHLNDTDLLIIDESFDKDKMLLYKSGFQISFIDTFIRNRYSQGKGMIFISNKKIDEIESQGLSYSIQDFINRETKLHNTYLTFEDNYLANSNIEFDPSESLF